MKSIYALSLMAIATTSSEVPEFVTKSEAEVQEITNVDTVSLQMMLWFMMPNPYLTTDLCIYPPSYYSHEDWDGAARRGVALHVIPSSNTSMCKFPCGVEDGAEARVENHGVADLGVVHHGEEMEDIGPRFQWMMMVIGAVDGEETEAIGPRFQWMMMIGEVDGEVMMMAVGTPLLASLARVADGEEVASPEKEVASPEKEVVDGVAVEESQERVEEENQGRVEVDGEGGRLLYCLCILCCRVPKNSSDFYVRSAIALASDLSMLKVCINICLSTRKSSS
jgi:hypothetical protein